MNKHYPHIKEGQAYTTETTWGPVVQSVGPCWNSGKHSTTCWVQREGMQPERIGLNYLPGHIVQVGERLGVLYKMTDTVVETYTVRDKWNRTMYPRESCWKKDKDCYWPSKGK